MCIMQSSKWALLMQPCCASWATYAVRTELTALRTFANLSSVVPTVRSQTQPFILCQLLLLLQQRPFNNRLITTTSVCFCENGRLFELFTFFWWKGDPYKLGWGRSNSHINFFTEERALESIHRTQLWRLYTI